MKVLSVDFVTNSIFNSRTYILSQKDSDVVWLVDCGDMDKVLDRIGEKKVEGVLLTHTHSDHIYGLGPLLEYFPNVKVYTNAYGEKALKSPILNLSHYHSEYSDIASDKEPNVRILKDGDTIIVLGLKVSVYETPGHDPSCLTFMMGSKLFTGDSYIPGVKVFTGFPHSNKVQAQHSFERIKIISNNCQIMPGHTLVGRRDNIY